MALDALRDTGPLPLLDLKTGDLMLSSEPLRFLAQLVKGVPAGALHVKSPAVIIMHRKTLEIHRFPSFLGKQWASFANHNDDVHVFSHL